MAWSRLSEELAEEFGQSELEIGPIGSGVHITTPSIPGRKNMKIDQRRWQRSWVARNTDLHRQRSREYARKKRQAGRLAKLVEAARRLIGP